MGFFEKVLAAAGQLFKPRVSGEDPEEKKLPVTTRFLNGWNQFMKFKKVFLAVPVAGLAIILAMKNLLELPALVGFGLQGNGEYAVQMIREVAVLGPLAVTAVCLLLMFVSKRTLTPWMVSLFSLLLPVLILITNTFPG